jgi:hypothetical protein
MPTIRITEETMAAIRHAAIYDFHQIGTREADGTWQGRSRSANARRPVTEAIG